MSDESIGLVLMVTATGVMSVMRFVFHRPDRSEREMSERKVIEHRGFEVKLTPGMTPGLIEKKED